MTLPVDPAANGPKLCAYCDEPAAGLIVQDEYEIEPGVLAVEDLDVCGEHSGLPADLVAELTSRGNH